MAEPGARIRLLKCFCSHLSIGTSPVSWVSFPDVAESATVLRNPAAERRTIEFGGPDALSPIEVVPVSNRLVAPFKVEHIPDETLRAQFEGATDSLQKSFAALMLAYSWRCDQYDVDPAGVWDQTHEY